jgi:hypothetical protein
MKSRISDILFLTANRFDEKQDITLLNDTAR